jgi:hypothetical protein
MLLLISCGGNSSNQEATAAGFSEIENQIKEKFGNDAYFTDLSITYNKSIGNIIGVTVTENPETLQMAQWNNTQDNWTQNSDIAVEIPEGTKAADFMFQLNETINLKKLGELVEQSKAQLTKEKNVENPKLHIASIQFPAEGSSEEEVKMAQTVKLNVSSFEDEVICLFPKCAIIFWLTENRSSIRSIRYTPVTLQY